MLDLLLPKAILSISFDIGFYTGMRVGEVFVVNVG